MDLTTTANSTATTVDDAGVISLPPFALQTLPHLSDYLPNVVSVLNPIDRNPYYHPSSGFYISPSDVVLGHILFDLSAGAAAAAGDRRFPAYHRAGPRRVVRFDPAAVRAAIVTCGGLCPGMNTVIRELVVGLWELYGVREIYGVPSGYRGFYSEEPVKLDPKMVDDWHKRGGTALATSRGGFDLERIVDAIERRGYNQVMINFRRAILITISLKILRSFFNPW